MVTPEFKASIDAAVRELASELQVPELMLRGEVCREDAEARAKGIGSVHHTPYGSMSSYPAVAAIVTSDPREMQVQAPNARLGSVLMPGEGCTPVPAKFLEVLALPDYDELRQQLADVSHERDLLRASRNVFAKKLAEAMGMVNGASDKWTAEAYELLLSTEVKS